MQVARAFLRKNAKFTEITRKVKIVVIVLAARA